MVELPLIGQNWSINISILYLGKYPDHVFLLYDEMLSIPRLANKLLKSNSSKSSCLVRLYPGFLKELAQEPCEPLMLIFNKSWKIGEVPDDFKKANVPVF